MTFFSGVAGSAMEAANFSIFSLFRSGVSVSETTGSSYSAACIVASYFYSIIDCLSISYSNLIWSACSCFWNLAISCCFSRASLWALETRRVGKIARCAGNDWLAEAIMFKPRIIPRRSVHKAASEAFFILLWFCFRLLVNQSTFCFNNSFYGSHLMHFIFCSTSSNCIIYLDH